MLLLAPEFYLPLRLMGNYYHARMEAIGAAERILPVGYPGRSPAAGASPLTAISPLLIRFENVSFRYTRIPLSGGRRHASWAQASGLPWQDPAGQEKAPWRLCFLGFALPEKGRVLVNGVDLAECDPDQWRRLVAWVPQRPHMFRGTVRDNIRMGRHDATEPDIILLPARPAARNSSPACPRA